MNVSRGVIQFRERSKQIRDFSGLRFGNITPTDIDALIEYKDKGYVFIETKHSDAQMPQGQRLALERIESDLSKSKPTLVMLTQHNCPSNVDIDMAQTIVVEYRYKGAWMKTKYPKTARELTARFINNLDGIKS